MPAEGGPPCRARAAATATPDVAISSSKRRQPGIVAAPVAQQARRVRAAHARKRLTRPAWCRVEAEHQPVEKPAAARGAFDEQPVHLRRQPEQGDVLGQGRSGRRTGWPSIRTSRRSTGRRPPVAAGADIDRAERSFDAGGNRPAGSDPLVRAADPLDIGQLGAAQAAAGRQEATASSRLVLPAPLAPSARRGACRRSAARPRSSGKRQGETRHRQLRSRTLIGPDSLRFRPGIRSGRIAQRHRNSSPTRDMARQETIPEGPRIQRGRATSASATARVKPASASARRGREDRPRHARGSAMRHRPSRTAPRRPRSAE